MALPVVAGAAAAKGIPMGVQIGLGALQGLSGALGGGEQRKQGRHSRYMDRRDANIQDLDRRAQYERRAARSPGSGHLLQQLAQRLGIQMPEGAFGGSREAVPGTVNATDFHSAFEKAYPSPQAAPPPPPSPRPSMPAAQAMGGANSRPGMQDLLKMYLGRF